MKKQRIISEEAEEQTKSDEAASRAGQERCLCDGEACQEDDKEIGAVREECG